MMAIAPARTIDPRYDTPPTPHFAAADADFLPCLADDDTHHFARVASPWRAPLFYLSFLAAILLLAAIAVLLVGRALKRAIL